MDLPEERIVWICTTVLAFLAAAFGWFKWWYELREKRKEKAEKEKEKAEKEQANAAKVKAETALAEARRRAIDTSPYFLLSKKRFNYLMIPTSSPWEFQGCPPGHTSLLCYARNEVDPKLSVGEFVHLLVENHGSDAFEISVQLDNELISFVGVEADHEPLYAFRYPYDPQRHGNEQTIKVAFLAANGFRDLHSYGTAHGFRALRRIDPI